MQVYNDLRILTARPSVADEALLPHKFYGVIDGAERYSVGHWLSDLQGIVQQVSTQGCWPILDWWDRVYLHAAEYGISAS